MPAAAKMPRGRVERHGTTEPYHSDDNAERYLQPRTRHLSRNNASRARTASRSPSISPSFEKLGIDTYGSMEDGLGSKWNTLAHWTTRLAIPVLLCLVLRDITLRYLADGSSSDPSGLLALSETFPQGTAAQLWNLCNRFDDLSRPARDIAEKLGNWKNKLSGVPLDQRAAKCASVQSTMQHDMRVLARGYSNFMEMMSKGADIVEWKVGRNNGRYNNATYYEASPHNAWSPSRSVHLPLSQLKQLFKDFATGPLALIKQLEPQTQAMLSNLETARNDLENLFDKFKPEWREWAQKCIGGTETRDFDSPDEYPDISVLSGCYHGNAEKVRVQLHRVQSDLKLLSGGVTFTLQNMLYHFRALECRYKTMMVDPRSRTKEENAQCETFEGYQELAADLSRKVKQALQTFKMHGDK